ncbi:hypothetical protein TNCV_3670041 [Trichonephila clavipes]|nr:hypothetical protein TNCV_3670041 [Trichonephila clavipes]
MQHMSSQRQQIWFPHLKHGQRAMDLNRYTNAELDDIHFIYKLANRNGRVAVRLRVTNPATVECNTSGCMEDTSQRIASFSSDRLDGPDRYTRDFKYPHNQKSAGVKPGDRGDHEYMQRLLTILSSPNVCIRNALTGLAV